MNFEETHPSLKGKEIVGDSFLAETIQQHTIDKEVVRKAIDKWIADDVDIETHGILMTLKKELGL